MTRLSLPPLHRSAWRSVLDSSDQRGLLNSTGFDRPTFDHLLTSFSPLWHSQRQRRSLRAEDVLGLVVSALAGEGVVVTHHLFPLVVAARKDSAHLP